MVDTRTTYLGLELKNPLVAGASPLSKEISSIRKLEDAGAAAVVLQSLFEEQIKYESLALDYYLNQGTESFAEALTYFPEMENYNIGPDAYAEYIQKVKKSVDIPVIGSLNGFTPGGWLDYAKKIEEAGADALELNIYYLPTELDFPAEDLEDSYFELVSDVRQSIRIPLAVKLSPYFSSLPAFSQRLVNAGANGLVLFNRFYQPDLDINQLKVNPELFLSSSHDLRLPLRWIAILYGRLQTDLILSSGVHTPQDLIKAILAGANAAQVVSALLARGENYVKTLLSGLEEYMDMKGYQSIQDLRGVLSQKNVAEPAAFERANYLKILDSYKQVLEE